MNHLLKSDQAQASCTEPRRFDQMQSMRLQEEGLIGVNHLSLFSKKQMPSEQEEHTLSSTYMLSDHT